MEIQREIRTFLGKSTYTKTRLNSKLVVFKNILWLILINQYKTLCIVLTNHDKASKRLGKFRKLPWKCVLGTTLRLKIFSIIQLIKTKFGRNIDGCMEEKSWKNEVYSFINFEIIFKNSPWKSQKDHISATKGSIFSRNVGHHLITEGPWKVSST